MGFQPSPPIFRSDSLAIATFSSGVCPEHGIRHEPIGDQVHLMGPSSQHPCPKSYPSHGFPIRKCHPRWSFRGSPPRLPSGSPRRAWASANLETPAEAACRPPRQGHPVSAPSRRRGGRAQGRPPPLGKHSALEGLGQTQKAPSRVAVEDPSTGLVGVRGGREPRERKRLKR